MLRDLDRFVKAQESIYPQVVRELTAGEKTSHWMWFIFPQIAGLGRSETARFYAIASLDEAVAYLQHHVLGPRLRECTTLVNHVTGRSLADIFGYIDAIKFRSCMTLFARATTDNAIFHEALDKYCAGQMDEATVELLQ